MTATAYTVEQTADLLTHLDKGATMAQTYHPDHLVWTYPDGGEKDEALVNAILRDNVDFQHFIGMTRDDLIRTVGRLHAILAQMKDMGLFQVVEGTP